MFPVLARFGAFELGAYGVLLVVAILAALFLAARLGARDGLSTKRMNDLGVLTLIAGVLGAKALDTLVNSVSAGRLVVTDFREAGAVHGGVLVGALTLVLAARRFKMPLGATLDAHAPALALGQALGRLGCFLAGCCFGAPTDGALAVTFHDLAAHRISGTPLGVPVHPVQLYDALAHFALAALLAHLHLRRRTPSGLFLEGRLLGVYFGLEGVVRFSLEGLRGDLGRGVWAFGLSTGRLTALAMLGLGAAILFGSAPLLRSTPRSGEKTS